MAINPPNMKVIIKATLVFFLWVGSIMGALGISEGVCGAAIERPFFFFPFFLWGAAQLVLLLVFTWLCKLHWWDLMVPGLLSAFTIPYVIDVPGFPFAIIMPPVLCMMFSLWRYRWRSNGRDE
jgi:hypothetical protein